MQKVNVNEENYNTFQLINDAMDIAKLLVNEDSIDFEQEIVPDMPQTLYGDRLKARQAIVDLIISVAKFIPEGKISLKYSFQNVNNKILLIVLAISNGNAFALSLSQGMPTISETKILVVDDDEMNIKIFKRFLRDTGIIVDMAMSGKECLEKMKTTDYNLIFTDYLMPEMNGLELLKNIRSNKVYNKIPIIVLTASGEGRTRKQFISNGFSDYLHKPIIHKELEEMLAKYLPAPLLNFSTKETNKKEKKSSKNNLNFKYINLSKGLKYAGNDIDIYKKFLNIYIETGVSKIKDINRAFENEDWPTYTILVHSLKSTSSGIGADTLAENLKILEKAGKENDIEYIKNNHQYTIKLYEQVMDDIKNNIDKDGTEKETKKHEISSEEFKNIVLELRSDVYYYYIEEAIETLDKLKYCVYNGRDMGEKLVPLLKKLIGNYRLDEAEKAIDILGEYVK